MATYKTLNKLIGYADSANATGRIGPSAFALLVDFAKVGAPASTGLVVTDVIDKIGGLPENCVVRTVAAQIVKPITVLSKEGISAVPIALKAGSTALASLVLDATNGPDKGATWYDVATLANGTIGVDGTKADLSLTVGAVLDDDDTATATGITGGILMLVLFVDYMPEVDELKALFDTIESVSDGGNTATEVTDFGLRY